MTTTTMMMMMENFPVQDDDKSDDDNDDNDDDKGRSLSFKCQLFYLLPSPRAFLCAVTNSTYSI